MIEFKCNNSDDYFDVPDGEEIPLCNRTDDNKDLMITVHIDGLPMYGIGGHYMISYPNKGPLNIKNSLGLECLLKYSDGDEQIKELYDMLTQSTKSKEFFNENREDIKFKFSTVEIIMNYETDGMSLLGESDEKNDKIDTIFEGIENMFD